MNKKRIGLLIPTVILLYIALFALLIIFTSTENSVSGFIMSKIFFDNALYLVGVFVLYCFICIVLSLICFVLSIVKKWDSVSLAKTARIIKILQIPAYIVIFVLGVVLAITPFGFGFVFIFIILDGLTLALTALVNIAAVINSVRQGDFTYKETWWVILLQFVFCADVVVSFIWCRMLKQKTVQQVEN